MLFPYAVFRFLSRSDYFVDLKIPAGHGVASLFLNRQRRDSPKTSEHGPNGFVLVLDNPRLIVLYQSTIFSASRVRRGKASRSLFRAGYDGAATRSPVVCGREVNAYTPNPMTIREKNGSNGQ